MASNLDYEVIIIGGGPAGLAAGAHLASAGKRVLLLEKESFGGQLMKLEWIWGYPAQGDKLVGAALAGNMIEEATKSGLRMKLGEVVEIETYSRCRSVACADGEAYTCAAVIFAGGLLDRPLAIPGEAQFQGRGVTHCALCDAPLYSGQTVAVCGGGNAAVLDALYFANFAAKVILIEREASLAAMPKLIERALGNAKLEIRCGVWPIEILGGAAVTGLVVANDRGERETLEITGIVVRYAFDPATSYASELLPLDNCGYVLADENFCAGAPDLLVAGDIRQNSLRSVAAAVSDGLSAAVSTLRYLG